MVSRYELGSSLTQWCGSESEKSSYAVVSYLITLRAHLWDLESRRSFIKAILWDQASLKQQNNFPVWKT